MVERSRRSFLNRLTGSILGLGAAVTTWPLIRSLVPNVLYEPPRRFKVGVSDNFQNGVTYLDEHRLFLLKDGNSFSAVSGVCTHLGCTIKFSPFTQKREMTVRNHTFQAIGEFHCPCHGSKFHGDGTNYSGPAPRPLQWYHIEISPTDGSLTVDLRVEVDRDFRLVV